jgi:hypothetical protein
MRKRILLAGAALLLATPATADGAKVEVALYNFDDPSSTYLRYEAGSGEQNQVTVDVLSAKKATVRIADAGAVLTTGDGCTRVSDHEANCRGVGSAELATGDLDDVVRVPGHFPVKVTAGPGDDTVATGSGRDTLDGGGGNDTLRAGGGDDTVTDGDWSRTGVGPDVLDGGPGHDYVDYLTRNTPVSVEIGASSPQGGPDEGDTLTGFENAGVESRADRLIGDDRPNLLQSYGSHATLRGRGGNDELDAYWEGRDIVAGGAGNDRLELAPTLDETDKPAADEISCGSGRDDVVFPVEDLFVPLDCEVVDYDSFYDPIYRLRGKLAGTKSQVVKIAPQVCPSPRDVHGARCRVTWALREKRPSGAMRGPLLARRAEVFAKDSENAPRVRLHLSRAGRRILQRRHGLDARVGELTGARKISGGFVMRVELR